MFLKGKIVKFYIDNFDSLIEERNGVVISSSKKDNTYIIEDCFGVQHKVSGDCIKPT